MNNHVFRKIRSQNLIPSDGGFLVFLNDFYDPLAEIRLELLVRLQVVGFHETLDFSICVPLLAVDLISTKMKKFVGEQFGYFADKFVEELVSGFLRGIHGGIEDTPLCFDFVWPWPRRQLR